MDAQLRDLRAEVQRLLAQSSAQHTLYETTLAEKHELAQRSEHVQNSMQELKRQLEALDAERKRSNAANTDRIVELQSRLSDSGGHAGGSGEVCAQLEQRNSALAEALREVRDYETHNSQLRFERDRAERRCEDLVREKTQQKERLDTELLQRLAANEQRFENISTLIELKDAEVETWRSAAQQHESAAQSMANSDPSSVPKHEHERQIQQLRDSYNQKRERMLAGHKAALDEITRKHQAVLSTVRSQAAEDSNDSQANLQAQLLKEKENHQTAIAQVTQERDAALDQKGELQQRVYSLTVSHSAEIDSLQLSHRNKLEKMTKRHENELAATSAKLEALDRLHLETISQRGCNQEANLAESESEHQNALSEAHDQCRALQESHVAAIDELRLGHDEQLRQIQQSHQAVLSEAEARQKDETVEVERQLVDERKQHIHQMDTLRADHSRTVIALKKDLAKAHKAVTELETFMTDEITRLQNQRAHEAGESPEAQLQAQAELAELEARHQAVLQEVEAQAAREAGKQAASDATLRESLESELKELREALEHAQTSADSRVGSMQAVVEELRERLDAELTAHAEAERALAKLRKERVRKSMQDSESTEALQQRIVSLRQEKEELHQRHRRSISSLLDLDGGTGKSTKEDSPTGGELLHARRQLHVAEQERQEAQDAFQTKATEYAEMARQNTFLVNELEEAMAQLNAAKSGRASTVDAQVQTEPPQQDTSKPTTPRSRRNTARSTSRPPMPVLPEDFREQKADALTMKLVQAAHRSARHRAGFAKSSHCVYDSDISQMSADSYEARSDAVSDRASFRSTASSHYAWDRGASEVGYDSAPSPEVYTPPKRRAQQLTAVPRSAASIPRAMPFPYNRLGHVPEPQDKAPAANANLVGPAPPRRTSSKPLPHQPRPSISSGQMERYDLPAIRVGRTSSRTAEPRAAHTVKTYPPPQTRVIPPSPNPTIKPTARKPNLKHSSSSIFRPAVAV